MSVKIEDRDTYPLELRQIILENDLVYSRDTRNKSYFFLRLMTRQVFETSDGDRFIVSDPAAFVVEI